MKVGRKHHEKSLKQVFLFCLVTTTIRKQNHCPPQVTSHHILEAKGRCYEFIKTPHKTWPDAEHDCNSRGGHLVSIGSKKEQFVINTELWVS